MLTGAQLRAARALVRLSAEDLAARSGVGVATIWRAEALDGPVKMISANRAAVASALEDAGVVFIAANGGGPGVRLAAATDGRPRNA